MPFLKKLIRPTANVTGIKEGLDTGVDTEL
jgi:hypothetical protein